MPVTPTRQHLGRPHPSLECMYYSGSVVFLPHLEQWCALDGSGQGSQPKGHGGQDWRVGPRGKVPALLFPLPSCGHEEYLRDGMDSHPTI